MKKLKRTIVIAIFIYFSFLIGKIMDYVLVDDTQSQSRIVLHDMYNEKENIDVLFLGSSHCYHSFDPILADELLQVNTFNAGTATQNLDGSLVLLKEVNKSHDISKVILELYYTIGYEPLYKERTDMTSTYVISDYLKPSINKYEYLYNASSEEHYMNSIFRARRYWYNLTDADKMLEIIQNKSASKYKEYKIDDATLYKGKGYFPVNEKLEDGSFLFYHHREPIDINSISKDWIASLLEIIEYCENNEIELILMSAPMPIYTIADIKNYDVYVEFVNELASMRGLEYYDFNLCKEEYFPVTISNFYDDDHLNEDGAELLTTLACELLSGKISKEELFYSTFNDKYKNIPEGIYGIIATHEPENNSVFVDIITNADMGDIRCDIIKHIKNKRSVVIENMDLNEPISYESGQKGYIEIKVFLKNKQLSHTWIEF